jgi:uncharacterized membrane protein
MEDDPRARFEAERAQEIARLTNQLEPLLAELQQLRRVELPRLRARDKEIEVQVGSIVREIQAIRSKKHSGPQ